MTDKPAAYSVTMMSFGPPAITTPEVLTEDEVWWGDDED